MNYVSSKFQKLVIYILIYVYNKYTLGIYLLSPCTDYFVQLLKNNLYITCMMKEKL